MTEVSYELPEIGEVSAAADPRTLNALIALKAWINGTGNVSESQLAAAIISKLNAKATGLESQKSIIATEETRENVAYGTLTTPDEVTVALPENGLIGVAYQATWKNTAAGTGRAAIFLNANQLRISIGKGPPVIQEASEVGVDNDNYTSLATSTAGLVSAASGSTGVEADVTTGQIIGVSGQGTGACLVFAGAGTYKISIQFKSALGKVQAKNRKLWCWVIS